MKPLRKTKPIKKKSVSRSFQVERHLRKFCNVTSQELGNVLGAIVGELDYALSSQSEVTRDRSMRAALGAAESALNLSRNLRYFAVHTRLDVHTADVSQIVLDTVDMLEGELKARGIQLSVLAEASAYATIDAGAIQQILLNLLSNANHAMPRGGKITVSLRSTKRAIEIRIVDNGGGIAPENLEKVFEPYFFAPGMKISRALTDHQGLGLAVTKALVEAHAGEITVESQLGRGTTFTVALPYDPDLPQAVPYNEKRRNRRVSITLPVEITFDGQTPVQTELTILSVGGCFIRLPETLTKTERNKTLRLRIGYLAGEELRITKARVASICRVGAHAGIGIEFLEIDEKARKVLTALVKSHVS